MMKHLKNLNFAILKKITFSFLFQDNNYKYIVLLLESSPLLKKVKIHSDNNTETIIDDLVLTLIERFQTRDTNIYIK